MPLYGCLWDMSKAFTSVSKPLIVLCWQRKGLPEEIAQSLVASGYTLVQSLLRNFAAAQKAFVPLKPKTCTSLYGKVDSASRNFPRWSSNARETAYTAYLHMGISGPSSPYKPSVPAGIPVRTTPLCRP